ncbi:beta strand repeat-containing protein [Agrobacterium larrymoorei]|uniref:Filamentous hemagglutinin N-terminal domain-containing protein n=2 Tax=Agrobacterium larrymoorei TaxID=160699 RepID=A0A4D7DS93_9HYPH|nr:GLUG motif-containing protein [Agrobacterium larrymoorei]QCJ00286.1 filamentous hemagglutinin N-terminal domain-containing protein [Agrobacterium larrymoorei]QYA09270.1 filamentous hemagglutinin N-terminal domain-containing protein [Agrobacterium larrymoorei]
MSSAGSHPIRSSSSTARSVRRGRFATALLTSTALTVTPLMAAENLPTGAQVVSGAVSVGTSGTSMTITQGSDKAIVNWNGFSVGSGNSVTFVQPGSTSAILNRVTGNTTSTIAGSITANGQVYLINPNGIAITSTGTVDVGGGFVASTLDISNEDFLNGNYKFAGNGASGEVKNEGIITVGRGGYAALIGGTVKNDGLIAVPVGKVGLGSGEQATLDLSGDGFLQVALPTKEGAEGNGALVENNGTIKADGGTVVMSAATARNAARHAVNLSGVVEADSISGSDGEIVIGGGEGGAVTVSGKVKTTSSTGKGGKVTVTGKSVALKGATIDASGKTGGGKVRIGGDYQGKGSLQTADTVSVDADTVIRADASESGNGGSVVVWSNDLTTFAGLITAHGAGTGTGGDAEVSGKAVLSYTGFTNLSGPGGFGTLLLDPYDITISDGEASNSSGFTATGENSVISVSRLETALANANVVISTGSSGSQMGNITVASDIEWSNATTLVLAASNNIYINADITATGASAGLTLYYGGYATTGSATSGTDYSIASGASITLSGNDATLAINGNNYTLIHSMSELDAIDTTDLSGRYALAGDLDASDTTYTSALVGLTSSAGFTGTFAGLGHTISGLTISNSAASGTYYGLFGYVSGATIRDVGLVDNLISITGSPSYVGGLIGVTAASTVVSNAYATGVVKVTTTASDVNVGGLIGYAGSKAVINDVYSTSNVTATGSFVAKAAGLIGYVDTSVTITDAYATGDVTVKSNNYSLAGGLVGYIGQSSTIKNSYATGNINSTSSGSNDTIAGGLIGKAYFATITNGYATGDVTANNTSARTKSYSTYAGGLVGNADTTTIKNSYSTSIVTSTDASTGGATTVTNYGGGLIGYDKGSTITGAYATGYVTVSNEVLQPVFYVGGLIGYTSSSTVTNAYATGGSSVINTAIAALQSYAGGLLGYSADTKLTNTYATGAVKFQTIMTWASGGLVGTFVNGSVTNSYFDITTTGVTYGVQTQSGMTGSVSGFTTSQFQNTQYFMQQASAWDFNTTWAPSSSGHYPELYALSTVVWVKEVTTSSKYGDSTATTSVGTTYGGTSSYVFASDGDKLLFSEETISVDPTTAAGSSPETLSTANTTITSSNGTVYRVLVYGTHTTTVEKATLTVTANSKTKTYGDTVLLTYSTDGLINGDELSGSLASDGSATSANVDSYSITLGTLNNSNYEITYVGGTLTVDKKTITVTADSKSKTYGDSVTLTYKADGLITGDTLSGSLASDGKATTAGADSYSITQGDLGNSNYIIEFKDGTLTVNKKALIVTANADGETYDGTAYSGGNGVRYNGFIEGENKDVLGGTLSIPVMLKVR